MAKYVTVKRVPLCKVGTWGASTGPTTITPEVLSSMQEAEQLVGRAVVKLGHKDPEKNATVFDGDPAYGQVANLKAEDDGILYGDLVNVPEELAEKMKSAYPNRSVEIAWGMKLRDAAGKVQKTIKAALVGLALLGVTPPAVKGLAALAAGEGNDVESVCQLSAMVLSPKDEEVQEALRDAAIGLYAEKREDIHLLQLDDSSVSFDTPNGAFRAKYTMDGDVYLFSDTETITKDVPQQTFTSKEAEVVNPGGNAEDNDSREEQAAMDFLAKLRAKLGLPESATEDEVFAAANPAPKAPSQLSADEVVPLTVFEGLRTDFAATQTELAELKKERETERRDQFITAMLSEGKVHVSERDFWRGQLDRDEEATKTFLSERTPVVNVSELGSSAAGNTNPEELKDDQFNEALNAFGMRPQA